MDNVDEFGIVVHCSVGIYKLKIAIRLSVLSWKMVLDSYNINLKNK